MPTPVSIKNIFPHQYRQITNLPSNTSNIHVPSLQPCLLLPLYEGTYKLNKQRYYLKNSYSWWFPEIISKDQPKSFLNHAFMTILSALFMSYLMIVLGNQKEVANKDKAKVVRKARARIKAKKINRKSLRKRTANLAPPRTNRSRASQGQSRRKLPKKRK